MEEGRGIVGEPADKEEHDDHNRDLGGPRLFLVQEEGGVTDAMSELTHDLG